MKQCGIFITLYAIKFHKKISTQGKGNFQNHESKWNILKMASEKWVHQNLKNFFYPTP